jgi:prepilin-type N-terminal cleavage/methylation domain-containing protein
MHQAISSSPRSAAGFTLIELIAVFVLLSILAITVVPKFLDLIDQARQSAVSMAISELNSREHLAWAKHKLTHSGHDDEYIFSQVTNSTLGPDFTWSSGPDTTGGELEFQTIDVHLTRRKSTLEHPGHWSR